MFKIQSDSLTPALARLAALPDQRRAATLQAIGLLVSSLATRAFTTPSLRPSPWPKRKDDLPHNLLLKKGTLRASVKHVSVSGNAVTVGSDRIYAMIHQRGGKIIPKRKKALAYKSGGKTVVTKSVTIPARPFFPFTEDNKPTATAEKQIASLINIKLGIATR